MTEPSHVWVVRTSMRDLHGWYYVGVETESEAHGLVGKKRQGDLYRCETHKKRNTCEGTRIASGSHRRLLGTLIPRISRNGSRYNRGSTWVPMYSMLSLLSLLFGGPVLARVRTVCTRLSGANDRAPFRPGLTGNFPVAANETAADCALYLRIQTFPIDRSSSAWRGPRNGCRRAHDTKERVGRTKDSF
jgi:hypothetical protein